MKKLTKIQKSTKILSTAKDSKWCYVNTDNEFVFMRKTFIIDESFEEYKVYNKAREVEDYTNESYMEEILVVIDKDNTVKYYNQNYDYMDARLIRVKE